MDLSSPGLDQILVDIIHIQFKRKSSISYTTFFKKKSPVFFSPLMKPFISNYSKQCQQLIQGQGSKYVM